jgi:rod shape determining protein RodA
MPSRDFIRQLPGAESHFSRRTGLFNAIHLDFWLLVMLLALMGFGLFILYSGSGQNPDSIERQGLHFLVATALMVLLAQFDPVVIRRWVPWLYGVGLLGLVAVLTVGADAKGAQRWLQIPGLGFRVQPSEFMKLAVPMMVAHYLSDRVLPPRFVNIVVVLVIILLPAALIVKQPDLGTALLVSAAGLFVLWFSGLSWRWIGSCAACVISLTPALWFFVMHDYQKQRVLTLLNPEQDPLGSGWNIIQSKTAIGSGGVYGKGWLDGTQSQLDFLPESHTDFIIAVLAEELGYLGVLAVLVLYLAIVYRGLFMAAQAQDTFSRILGAAIVMTFFIYVFVNMGMVSGILPIVGVPLPLISYGGTSVLTLMVSFGLLMSIHTHRKMLSR